MCRQSPISMANQQLVVDNSERTDSSAFTIPETSGFDTDTNDGGSCQRWYIHITNGFDVSVDVAIRGSHFKDESMTNAAQDGQTITIASGESDFIDGESAHSYIDVEVTPNSTPTSGNITVTYQTREW